MTILTSQISTASETFTANTALMRALVSDIEAKAASVIKGGTDEVRERHTSAGQALAPRPSGPASRSRFAIPRDRPVRRLGHL